MGLSGAVMSPDSWISPSSREMAGFAAAAEFKGRDYKHFILFALTLSDEGALF